MASVKLYLSNKIDKDSNKSEIYLRFSGGRKTTKRIKSGFYIDNSRWDNSNSRIIIPRIKSKENEETKKLILELDKLSTFIINEFDTAVSTDINLIDDKWFDQITDRFHYPEKYVEKNPIFNTTMMTFIEYFIKNIAPQRKHEKTGLLLSSNLIQQFNATNNLLKEYFKTQKNQDLYFQEIDNTFKDNFISFLQKKDFYLNTVGKHIRVLKSMLNSAPPDLKVLSSHSNFPVFTEETDNIFFTAEEINKLWEFDFSKQTHLEKVVHWFIILCWTGARFSDLNKVIKVKKGDKYIRYKQQKTKTKVVLPIHDMVRKVFEKYDYKVPTPISNQKFNDELKIAVKAVGFTENIEINRTIGNKVISTIFEKHQVVSSHTGRRSFCTNSFISKIPTLYIMKASGHKTEKSFLKYIKMTEEEHAEKMAVEWEKIYEKEKSSEISNDIIELNQTIEKLNSDYKILQQANITLSQIFTQTMKENNELKIKLESMQG